MPVGVEVLVVMERVDDVLLAVTEVGLNVALAPEGNPLTVRPTVPE